MRPFEIVLGFDGSSTARAALATTLLFPWPEEATVHGVVARRTRTTVGRPVYVREAFGRAFEDAAAEAQRKLAARWAAPEIPVVDAWPAAAILREARRVRARVIVVGWRGHGPVRRLLLGSVSRNVVRDAPCSVLVVRRRRTRIRRLVVGLDGSLNARRAVALVRELAPPAGGSATLVTALDPVFTAHRIDLPAAPIGGKLAPSLAAADVGARRELDKAADALRGSGWRVRTVLRSGAPLAVLLATVAGTDADLLVLGATGSSALHRVLVGSVAAGALDRCPVPVLLAR